MALRKVVSKATVANDSYTGLVTQSHSKSYVRTRTRFCPQQEKLGTLPLLLIYQTKNLLFNNSTPASNLSNKESHLEVVSVMMANMTVEAAMAKMERKINFLMKVVEERDYEIAALKDQINACETAESSKAPAVNVDDKEKAVLQENQMQQSMSIASLSIQQVQDMITSSIRAQYGEPPQASFMYSMSYTKRINDL
ncbi:ty3-gypsy retrotransposon protein [Cucumis melo var. makuwa]|uniref:Ty3-gypsy retrotransposon protein n=1 Tax=Cucumis melo var. makuwa TaxID=1194695 RepID=A0A5D3DHF9_CUCMM|nr:ty3-gypsy retrotransposon protein [Cucumis melo var. makuwa]TYK22790.1 ty3-gypsy retrotransposon protein [Cucumis melo var. makuwa]